MKNQGKKNRFLEPLHFLMLPGKDYIIHVFSIQNKCFTGFPCIYQEISLLAVFSIGTVIRCLCSIQLSVFINHIFLIFWRAQFGWNWPVWSKSTGWRQKRCLTHSDIHKARTKINLVVSSLKYTFWVLAFHHDSFKPIQWKSE